MKPLLVMLAGPNGAGKSTFHEAFLSGLGLPFLNADVLAKVTGIDSYRAAGIMDETRRLMVGRGTGFVTETVFSDPVGAKVQFLKEAVDAEFEVRLIYIGIATRNLSLERVASRVRAGGHDVPRAKILARYPRSLENLERAIACLPRVTLYDNSSFENPFRFVAEFHNGKLHSRGEGPAPKWARGFIKT